MDHFPSPFAGEKANSSLHLQPAPPPSCSIMWDKASCWYQRLFILIYGSYLPGGWKQIRQHHGCSNHILDLSMHPVKSAHWFIIPLCNPKHPQPAPKDEVKLAFHGKSQRCVWCNSASEEVWGILISGLKINWHLHKAFLTAFYAAERRLTNVLRRN